MPQCLQSVSATLKRFYSQQNGAMKVAERCQMPYFSCMNKPDFWYTRTETLQGISRGVSCWALLWWAQTKHCVWSRGESRTCGWWTRRPQKGQTAHQPACAGWSTLTFLPPPWTHHWCRGRGRPLCQSSWSCRHKRLADLVFAHTYQKATSSHFSAAETKEELAMLTWPRKSRQWAQSWPGDVQSSPRNPSSSPPRT